MPFAQPGIERRMRHCQRRGQRRQGPFIRLMSHRARPCFRRAQPLAYQERTDHLCRKGLAPLGRAPPFGIERLGNGAPAPPLLMQGGGPGEQGRVIAAAAPSGPPVAGAVSGCGSRRSNAPPDATCSLSPCTVTTTRSTSCRIIAWRSAAVVVSACHRAGRSLARRRMASRSLVG